MRGSQKPNGPWTPQWKYYKHECEMFPRELEFGLADVLR